MGIVSHVTRTQSGHDKWAKWWRASQKSADRSHLFESSFLSSFFLLMNCLSFQNAVPENLSEGQLGCSLSLGILDEDFRFAPSSRIVAKSIRFYEFFFLDHSQSDALNCSKQNKTAPCGFSRCSSFVFFLCNSTTHKQAANGFFCCI